MRKPLILPTIILISLFMVHCQSSKKIEYDIYEGLKPEDKAFIMATVESGKELFKVSCADCHGVFGRGSKNVTNFSEEQIHDYKNSFIMGDTENHAVADNLTPQELDQILMFLMFLKRD